MDQKYIFNHYYRLRHDHSRTLLFASSYQDAIVNVDKDWVDIIHPIYAMVLSFFSRPILLDEVEKRIATFFSIHIDVAHSLLTQIIDKDEHFHIVYKGYENRFPPNIIVSEEKMNSEIRDYDPSMFLYKSIDLDQTRIVNAPLDITFMVNNVCLTKCVYCYADKNRKCSQLDFQTVKRIIQDAYQCGIRHFSVDGGDFFLYPYWRDLLVELKRYNYRPSLVSTKYPVSEKDIMDFSTFDVPLQVSIDSFDQLLLDRIVGRIPDYSVRIQNSMDCIDKYMYFQIATILTKFNGCISNLNEMYHRIRTYKHIRKWDIRVGFKSLYTKHDFSEFKVEEQAITAIKEWVDNKQREASFMINFSPGREANFFKSSSGSKDFIGAICSADSTHMFILPDGQVTICEQLYWNKKFLIGDLTKQTISEVWNSPNALRLAFPTRQDFSEKSVCRNCTLFESCTSHMNKCFANILKVYGIDNWDYPDPRCSFAPRSIPSIYV